MIEESPWNMDCKSHISNDEGRVSTRDEQTEGRHARRMTRFPRGTPIQLLSLPRRRESPSRTRVREPDAVRPPRLPLRLNPPTATATPSKSPPIQHKSPWDTYKSIRVVDRGGLVTVSCMRSDSARLATVKKLPCGLVRELVVSHHENLLSVLEVYKFETALFMITDYTLCSLQQIILLHDLQEPRISSICYQVTTPLYKSKIGDCRPNCSQVFKGMQHLARFSLAHQKLDSSRILLVPENPFVPAKSGLVKIGMVHF